MIVYVIKKISGDNNSLDSLKVVVNYHYNGQNRLIIRELPSMAYGIYETDGCIASASE